MAAGIPLDEEIAQQDDKNSKNIKKNELNTESGIQ